MAGCRAAVRGSARWVGAEGYGMKELFAQATRLGEDLAQNGRRLDAVRFQWALDDERVAHAKALQVRTAAGGDG